MKNTNVRMYILGEERESGVKVFWTLIFEMESLNDGRVVYYAQ